MRRYRAYGWYQGGSHKQPHVDRDGLLRCLWKSVDKRSSQRCAADVIGLYKCTASKCMQKHDTAIVTSHSSVCFSYRQISTLSRSDFLLCESHPFHPDIRHEANRIHCPRKASLQSDWVATIVAKCTTKVFYVPLTLPRMRMGGEARLTNCIHIQTGSVTKLPDVKSVCINSLAC